MDFGVHATSSFITVAVAGASVSRLGQPVWPQIWVIHGGSPWFGREHGLQAVSMTNIERCRVLRVGFWRLIGVIYLLCS